MVVVIVIGVVDSSNILVEYDADSRREEIEDIGGGEVNGVFFRSLGRCVILSFCRKVVRSLGR